MLRTILGCTLVLLLCSGLTADDKKGDKVDAAKLVGKWQLKDQKVGGVTMEFSKDGKVTVAFNFDGKEDKETGAYKVEGNVLIITAKADGKEEVRKHTITKLTDAELVLKAKSGMDDTLIRVKGK